MSHATQSRPPVATPTRWAGDGLRYFRGALDRAEQGLLLDAIRSVLGEAPLYVPQMPRSGQPMRVRESNCGALGWYTDRDGGYRYVDRHPETGRPWPAMPHAVLELWQRFADYPAPPEAGLINYYDASSKMGLHRDEDEAAADAPVVSISLGDAALFRVGGPERRGPTGSVRLESGDVIVLAGRARHYFHGIDRIYAGSSKLLAESGFPEGGRINLTLRRVTVPPTQPLEKA